MSLQIETTPTSSSSNIGINVEKKQSMSGLIQDIMTLLYCMVIIPTSLTNITYNQNNFTPQIYFWSYTYFIVTGLMNIYYLEYNFVVHHVICLNLIALSHSNTNQAYIIWLSYCFMAEISNIFLSIKNILKHIEKILPQEYLITLKYIQNTNDIMFFIGYFGIRILFLFPLTYIFVKTNYSNLIYPNFILTNIILMSLLNLYWGFLIIKKAQKSINKMKSK